MTDVLVRSVRPSSEDLLRIERYGLTLGDLTRIEEMTPGIEQRHVVLGESNDVFAEVKEGLKEGEQVVLNPHALQAPRKAPASGQGRLALVAASRIFPMQVRSPLTGRTHRSARIVATTPAYGVVQGLDDYLVDESQRFLADHDQDQLAAVAVLGAEAALSSISVKSISSLRNLPADRTISLVPSSRRDDRRGMYTSPS